MHLGGAFIPRGSLVIPCSTEASLIYLGFHPWLHRRWVLEDEFIQETKQADNAKWCETGAHGELLLPIQQVLLQCWKADKRIFMRSINEHHTYDLLWVRVGVQARIQSSEGLTDQYVGARDARLDEERLQFRHDAPTRTRFRAGVTPAIACPVIGTHPREGCHAWLHQAPIEGTAT